MRNKVLASGGPELGGPELGLPILELRNKVLARSDIRNPTNKLFREQRANESKACRATRVSTQMPANKIDNVAEFRLLRLLNSKCSSSQQSLQSHLKQSNFGQARQ